MSEIIKLKRASDWSGKIDLIGGICVALSFLSLLTPVSGLFFILLFIGITLLSIGKRIFIDLEKGTIVIKSSILFFIIYETKATYSKGEFDKVKLYQFSEIEGRDNIIIKTTARVREYHIILFTEDAPGNRMKLMVYEDYKLAQKLARTIAKNWNYKLEDDIQDKLRANKIDRDRRMQILRKQGKG